MSVQVLRRRGVRMQKQMQYQAQHPGSNSPIGVEHGMRQTDMTTSGIQVE